MLLYSFLKSLSFCNLCCFDDVIVIRDAAVALAILREQERIVDVVRAAVQCLIYVFCDVTCCSWKAGRYGKTFCVGCNARKPIVHVALCDMVASRSVRSVGCAVSSVVKS